MSEEDELEEDLLDAVAEISPLSALDPETVDRLTPKQRVFLLAFINTGSIAQSRKRADIKLSTWEQWKKDEQFQRSFAIIKSPIAFASNLSQAIILQAALEHYKLLKHEKVSVRQWAIERAYNILAAQTAASKKEDDTGRLTQGDIKQIAERVGDQLDNRLNPSSPFSFIEGEVVKREPATPAETTVN